MAANPEKLHVHRTPDSWTRGWPIRRAHRSLISPVLSAQPLAVLLQDAIAPAHRYVAGALRDSDRQAAVLSSAKGFDRNTKVGFF